MNRDEKHRLILHLESLADERNPDRGALAKLRRALQYPAEAYPVILPYVRKEISDDELSLYALLSALFALHPHTTDQGNMGAHLRMAAGENVEATERRFMNLLRANSEDLPMLLRQSISFLRSKAIAVNWEQLRRDLLAWNHADGYVQKQWARSFWSYQAKKEQSNSNNEENK